MGFNVYDVHAYYKQNSWFAIQPNLKIHNEFGIDNNHIFIKLTPLMFSRIFQNQGPLVSMFHLVLLHISPIFMTCSFKYYHGIKCKMVQNYFSAVKIFL